FLFFFCSQSSFSQGYAEDNLLDSLRNELAKENIHDTTHFLLRNIIGTQIPVFRIAFWDSISNDIENAILADPPSIVKRSLLKSHAFTLSNMGYISFHGGDVQTAIDFWTKSFAISEEIGDNRGISRSLNNLSFVYKNNGEIEKTLGLLLRSLEIREGMGNKGLIASSLANIGSVYKDLGNIPKALEYYNKSLNILWSIDDKSTLASVINSVAIIYNDQGDTLKCLEYYNESLDISLEIGDKDGAGRAYTNMGTVYNNNPSTYKIALDYQQKALILFEELGEKKGISYTLHNLGVVYENMSDLSKALEHYQKALAIREEIGNVNGIGNSLISIGNFYCDQKNIPLAEQNAVKAYEIFDELKFPKEQIKAAGLMKLITIVKARKALKTNNNTLASNLYQQADSFALEAVNITNKNIISNFTVLSEKSQEKYFGTVASTYMDFNSYALMRKADNPKIVDVVYNNSIKNKGLLLKSSTAMRNAIFNSNDTILINNYNQWVQLKKGIARLYAKGKDTKELEEEANEFEKELVKSSALFSDFNKLQDLSWLDVQKSLESNEVAIEFIHFQLKNYEDDGFNDFSDTVIYCALIVTPTCTSPEMIRLFNEKELENVLGKFGGNNLEYVQDIYGKKSEHKTELYKLIWQPIEKAVKGANRVFVSPTGLLHKISFAALAKDQDVYLCDKYLFENKSSTGIIKKDAKSSFSTDFSVTVFGGINYDTDSTDRKIWSYLHGTKLESEKITEYLKAHKVDVTYLSNSKATEEQFKLLATQSNIMHIATHGFFYEDPNKIKEDMEKNIVEEEDFSFRGGGRGFGVNSFVNNSNPLMRSGLVFAGANDVWSQQKTDSLDDGVLTAQEVAHVDMRKTELVVLSACETGLGDIKGSEGVYGLQRAFKMAGVKFIIMSLWEVPDTETEEFMTLFYKKLLRLKDIKDAFSETQKDMRQKYDPYFWAAFVLVE
ncbi:MAG: CHAT domain-containing protein/tetratricopeptide (TPR) repeat protein, partial [Arenicella sp.]